MVLLKSIVRVCMCSIGRFIVLVVLGFLLIVWRISLVWLCRSIQVIVVNSVRFRQISVFWVNSMCLSSGNLFSIGSVSGVNFCSGLLIQVVLMNDDRLMLKMVSVRLQVIWLVFRYRVILVNSVVSSMLVSIVRSMLSYRLLLEKVIMKLIIVLNSIIFFWFRLSILFFLQISLFRVISSSGVLVWIMVNSRLLSRLIFIVVFWWFGQVRVLCSVGCLCQCLCKCGWQRISMLQVRRKNSIIFWNSLVSVNGRLRFICVVLLLRQSNVISRLVQRMLNGLRWLRKVMVIVVQLQFGEICGISWLIGLVILQMLVRFVSVLENSSMNQIRCFLWKLMKLVVWWLRLSMWIWKLRKLCCVSIQIVVSVSRLNNVLRCIWLFLNSVGRWLVLLNSVDCGKLKLFGFFNGLCMLYSSRFSVMQLSMMVVRILLVLKCVCSQVVNLVQSVLVVVLVSSIQVSVQWFCQLSNWIVIVLLVRVLISNWFFVLMFYMCVWQVSVRLRVQSRIGMVLISSLLSLQRLLSGCISMVCRVCYGLWLRQVNSSVLQIRVSSFVSSGEVSSIQCDCWLCGFRDNSIIGFFG